MEEPDPAWHFGCTNAAPSMNGPILVVDGDPDRLAWLVELLEWSGLRATPAATFETARRLIKDSRYDLLITALRLQAYNGLHLVFSAQMAQPNTAAVVLADVADAVCEQEARDLGAHYVPLPVGDVRLMTIVTAALQERLAATRARPSAARQCRRPDARG